MGRKCPTPWVPELLALPSAPGLERWDEPGRDPWDDHPTPTASTVESAPVNLGTLRRTRWSSEQSDFQWLPRPFPERWSTQLNRRTILLSWNHITLKQEEHSSSRSSRSCERHWLMRRRLRLQNRIKDWRHGSACQRPWMHLCPPKLNPVCSQWIHVISFVHESLIHKLKHPYSKLIADWLVEESLSLDPWTWIGTFHRSTKWPYLEDLGFWTPPTPQQDLGKKKQKTFTGLV